MPLFKTPQPKLNEQPLTRGEIILQALPAYEEMYSKEISDKIFKTTGCYIAPSNINDHLWTLEKKGLVISERRYYAKGSIRYRVYRKLTEQGKELANQIKMATPMPRQNRHEIGCFGIEDIREIEDLDKPPGRDRIGLLLAGFGIGHLPNMPDADGHKKGFGQEWKIFFNGMRKILQELFTEVG